MSANKSFAESKVSCLETMLGFTGGSARGPTGVIVGSSEVKYSRTAPFNAPSVKVGLRLSSKLKTLPNAFPRVEPPSSLFFD